VEWLSQDVTEHNIGDDITNLMHDLDHTGHTNIVFYWVSQ